MTSNYVDKVLVTNGTQGASVTALTAGQYTVEVDGKANNSVLTPLDKFRVVTKSPSGVVLYGDWIKAKYIRSISKVAPRAKVEQVVTVTLGTLAEGKQYILRIVNTADREIFGQRQDKRAYEVYITPGMTATQAAASFVAQINKDQASEVTATSAAGVITLTAISQQDVVDKSGVFGKQSVLKVSLAQFNPFGYDLPAGTIAYTTAPNRGEGTFAQIRKFEDAQQGYHGYLNRTLFPADVYPFGSIAGKTYTQYVIEDVDSHTTNGIVLNYTDAPRTNIIATEVATALDVIFADLLA